MSEYVATIGNIGSDVTGFRRTHQQALEAARVARLMVNVGHRVIVSTTSASSRFCRPTSAKPTSSFTVNWANSRPPAETPKTSVRLCCPIWNASAVPEPPPARLYIARNTVTYRVKRAEELIGHSLDDREAEIWMALKIAQTLGVSGDTRCRNYPLCEGN